MSKVKSAASRIVRIVCWLAIVCSSIVLSAVIASHLVTKQLAAIVRADASRRASAVGETVQNGQVNQNADRVPIDFYKATGITEAELRKFLTAFSEREGIANYPALLTLQNEQGDYLVDGGVIVRWQDGQRRLKTGKSAVVRFLLDDGMLSGLTLMVPRGYEILRQHSIPLGTAYQPPDSLETGNVRYRVQRDGEIQSRLTQELLRIEKQGQAIPYASVREQLRRDHVSFALESAGGSSEMLTPEQIYQTRMNSVVVVASLFANGRSSHASGVVLDSSGIVATAYHVVDKPDCVAQAIMTSDGQVFPLEEVLAASQSQDVAIIKIDATDLSAAPLSSGDREGAPVTIIAHPDHRYYNLSHGCISRYWGTMAYGRAVVRMAVTADFADGSSGGPIFNDRGEVTGLVSSTDKLGDQMVYRVAAPVDSIRRLIKSPNAAPQDKLSAAATP